MSLQKLSKRKSIYHVYVSKDGSVHCEKFPIIYANKHVVYYRASRDAHELEYVKIGNIYKTIKEAIRHIPKTGFSFLVWQIDDDYKKDLNYIKIIVEKETNNRIKKSFEQNLEQARERYLNARNEYEKLYGELPDNELTIIMEGDKE